MPNVLLFGTGGVAREQFSFSGVDAFTGRCPNCDSTAFSQTLHGMVAGGGVDWALNNNWILQFEYLHYYHFTGLPSIQVPPGSASSVFFNWGNVSPVDFFRVGLSFKLP
jgi:opacity protein-like surface antigen